MRGHFQGLHFRGWFRPGRWPVAALAALGFGLLASLGLFFWVRHWELNRCQGRLEVEAARVAAALQMTVDHHVAFLEAFGALQAVSDGISRSQFQQFAADHLAKNPEVQALEWIPRVPLAEREEWEAAAWRDGLAGFLFNERDEQGGRRQAAARAEYYPAYFVEPLAGNEAAVGFDLGSEPLRRQALELARDSGELVATPPITLVQERERQAGFLIFRPVYSPGLPAGTPEERRVHLAGFGLAVFRAGDMVERTLARLPPLGLDILVTDAQAAAGDGTLHFHRSRTRPAAAPAEAPGRAIQPYCSFQTLALPGRPWTLRFTPAPAFLEANGVRGAWLLLAGGVGVTLLTAGYLLSLGRRAAELAAKVVALQQAELALRESEGKLESVFANAADGILVASQKGKRFRLCNPKICQMLGYGEAELLSLEVTAIHPEAELPAVVETFERLARGEFALAKEIPVKRKDGSVFYADINSFPISLGGEECLVGFFRDISERKRMEEALRESEGRPRTIMDAMPTGLLVIDPESRLIADANPMACQLLGAARGQVVGAPCHRFLAAAEPGRCPATALGRALADGEGVLLAADGGRRPILKTVTKVNLGGRQHLLAAFVDISDQKRAAVALRKAKAAAEDANRQKSVFLANMSHEIRTPMHGVLGMAELLLTTGMTPEQREYALAVKSSAESLLAVIDDILDFSKVEEGKILLAAAPFDLAVTLDAVLELFAAAAAEKGLELACHLAPTVPTAVVGDQGRLRQILVNLVGNALKFTDHGEVLLSVWPETTAAAAAGTVELHFAVADSGAGIPPEKQRQVFQAFYQGDATPARRHGGTGLGLAISSRFVALMGGRIWVESTLGKGSTFHFTVRLGLAAGVVPEAAVALQGRAVLVVDDNATSRRILDDLLRRWQLRPVLAESGPAALRELAQARQAGSQFDLSLVDANMPEMDGFAVVAELRRNPELGGGPILMMFASPARQQVEAARCQELGIAGHVAKPIRQAALFRALQEAWGLAAAVPVGPPAAAAEPGAAARPRRVLLAEDNPVSQKIVVAMLEKVGHAVVVANNGKEVLAALATPGGEAFDLILMDVQMPEMDGVTATQRIREEERAAGGHIPIVALTASAMKSDMELCLAAGMDDYLTKPLQRQDLLAAIARWPAGP